METLANLLKPTKLSEIVGQQHLIGHNKIFSNLVKNKKIFSMILYGKPGTGKNSIANAIVHELNLPYRELNAVINNKKDIDIVIEEAKNNGDMIVIMDEIHRMNKDKQDLLLPYIESGLIILLGLTTANPYHKINPAIRSRCHIFRLNDLTEDDIIIGINRALAYLKNVKIDNEAIKYIASLSGGDLRNALNLLDISYHSSANKKIDLELIKSINAKPIIFYDNNEDGHYDVLSAFQKSIRGSDVDAAIHYLGRLIEVEDLDSIYRRMAVIAYEDIGLSNPGMGPKVYAAIQLSEMLGLPEARIILTNVVIELALSPKSNSAVLAIDLALNDIRMGKAGNIPLHLKNSSLDYKYPHSYPKYYVKQQYLPDSLLDKKYYYPKNNKYESNLFKINDEMKKE